jgi:hypothetical protein
MAIRALLINAGLVPIPSSPADMSIEDEGISLEQAIKQLVEQRDVARADAKRKQDHIDRAREVIAKAHNPTQSVSLAQAVTLLVQQRDEARQKNDPGSQSGEAEHSAAQAGS